MAKQATSSRSRNPLSPSTPFSSPPLRRKSPRLHPEPPRFLSPQISPMRGEENPRRREEGQLGTATPMAEPATASGSRNLFSPDTPFSPYSSNKPVLLYNWWLILAEQNYNGNKLGVEGWCTRGKKAARVFTSTPIIKRYDAYTLEIAHGITVMIQGVIDKARTSRNGFPLEVCNRFLTGFPVNWDDYADGNFGEQFTSTSVPTSASDVDELCKGSADSAGRVFPVHLDEFSMSRIHAGLTLMGCSIDNLSGRNFIDTLKRFCSHRSVSHTKQMSSDAQIYHLSKMKGCWPEQTLSKSETCKINQQGNNTGCSTLVDHAEGLEASHAEEQRCHRNDINEDGVLGESSTITPTNFKNNVSFDSSLLLNSKTDSLSGIEIHMQKVTLLENKIGVEENNHIPPPNEFIGDGMNQAEEELTGRSPWNATEEILSKYNGDGHTNHGNISFDSSLHLNSKTDSLSGREIHMQKVTLLENKIGVEKNNHIPPPSEFIGDGMNQAEEELTGRSPWNAAEEILSKDNGDGNTNHGDISLRVVRKLNHTRGHRNSPASITNKSGSLDQRLKFSSMERTEIVAGIATTATTTLTRRTKKVEGVQAIKSSMEVEKNGAKSVPVDQSFVNSVDDKHKYRHIRVHDLAKVGSVKGTLKSSVKEVDRDLAPTGETHIQADGHANDQIGMNGGGDNESLKRSVEYSVKVASQSDIMMEVHLSKDKKQNMSGNKTRKTQNTKTRKTRNTKTRQTWNTRYEKQSAGLAEVEPTKDTSRNSCNSRKTVWTPSYSYVDQSPVTRNKAKKLPFASPESLNLRRSRSGRLLVPRLDHWRQQLIYNMDGEITGITGVDVSNYQYVGNQSEPPKKKRKLL